MTSDFAQRSCLPPDHRRGSDRRRVDPGRRARPSAEDLIVKYDQSQLLRLPKPAAEIIVGNPSIADVAVQSGNLLVVTGKTFGITNIIALDADRNVIQDQRVLVKRDEGKVVNLQRGTDRQSYNCTPQCNPSITIGDEQKYFEAIRNASQNKIGFSEGSRRQEPAAGPIAAATDRPCADRRMREPLIPGEAAVDRPRRSIPISLPKYKAPERGFTTRSALGLAYCAFPESRA